MRKLIFLFAIFSFFSCKKKKIINKLPQKKDSKNIINNDILLDSIFYTNESSLIEYRHETYSKNNNEIFIGKKFYEGDELEHYLFLKNEVLSKDSVYCYSIYKNKYDVVFSLEKLINYEDVRQFLIIDTIVFKKSHRRELIIKKPSIEDSVLIIDKTNN